MADEKKIVAKENASDDAKSAKKVKKEPSRFSPKRIGKGIARFFKDLRGETKKIVWPGRKMVIKSTGIVLAAIVVIGAGIWLIDFAVSGAISGVNKIAAQTEATTEATTEPKIEIVQDGAADEEKDSDDDTKKADTAQ